MPHDSSGCSRRQLLQGFAAAGAACALGDSGMMPAWAAEGGKHGMLHRAKPAALGIDPAAILAFVEGVDQKVGGLHSFMLLRHGQVAAEGWWAPYAPQYPHMLYSLSKSFTSTAVGFAVTQGLLSVDAPVVSFFPNDLPAKVGDNLAHMQVRHLLSMSTGHDKDATGPMRQAPDGNWVKAFLALPVEHEPGTKFVYNSAATYMLSAIVQKLSGTTVLNYLTPRLFQPLGIEHPTWETCPRGINTGGWGLAVKTEDIARFGQTYLQKGKWAGKQVVPAEWVSDATTKHISNGTAPDSDWSQGYGYQFWRCRHGAFRGDGAFGQYCVVMPEQDAVLAITSGVGDMQAVLNVVWEHLLPGMTQSSVRGAEQAELEKKLSTLAVPLPAGEPASLTGKHISRKTFRFPENTDHLESATVVFTPERGTVTLRRGGSESRQECGTGEWVKGTYPLNDQPDAKVAARGLWTAPDTFTMRLAFYETPYVETLTWQFGDGEVSLTSKMNVGFGPTAKPPLVGKSG